MVDRSQDASGSGAPTPRRPKANSASKKPASTRRKTARATEPHATSPERRPARPPDPPSPVIIPLPVIAPLPITPDPSLPITLLLPLETRVPDPPRMYIPRHRLNHMWDEWETRRLVVISAPAGYGKTTLLAANVGRSGRRVFWYACGARYPIWCTDEGTRSIGQAEADSLLPHHLLALLDHIRSRGERWNIVIDAFDRWNGDPELTAILERFAAHLPAGSTLFIASRGMVPIQTAKMAAGGVAVALDARDLAFTVPEAEALVEKRFPRGPRPVEETIEKAVTKTEGWGVGLGLWLYRLETTPKGGSSEIEIATPDWYSYFQAEVIDDIPPMLATFLTRASILPECTGGLCDHVLGIDESKALLAETLTRGLFAESTPRPEDEPTYRLHPIFRDFLEKTLHDTVAIEEIQALCRRAAEYMERHQVWAVAAAAYAKAASLSRNVADADAPDDAASAIEIIEEHGNAEIDAGRGLALERTFRILERADYDSSPEALHVLGRVHETQSRWKEAGDAYDAALGLLQRDRRRIEAEYDERFCEAACAVGVSRPPGSLANLAVVMGSRPSTDNIPSSDPALECEIQRLLIQVDLHLGNYSRAAYLCHEVLKAPVMADPHARATLSIDLAGCLSELGHYDECEKVLRKAMKTFVFLNDALGQARVHYMYAITLHHPRGEWTAGRIALGKAADYFHDNRFMTCLCTCIHAIFEIEDGIEWHARQLAQDALRQAKSLRARAIEGLCLWTLGRCARLRANAYGECAQARPLASRDREEALTHFTEAYDIGVTLPNTDLQIFPILEEAEIYLDDGTSDLARWAVEDAYSHACDHGVRLGEAQANIVMGRCARAERTSIREWERAEEALREMGATAQLHRVLLLRLQANDIDEEQRPAIVKELLQGIVRMRHERLLTVLEPSAAVAFLIMAIQYHIGGQRPRDLLLRMGDRAVTELRRLRSTTRSRKTQQACSRLISEIRLDIDDGLREVGPRSVRGDRAAGKHRAGMVADSAPVTGPPKPSSPASLRIRLLGSMRVEIGDRIIRRGDWPRVNPLRVFLYLVTRHDRWVPTNEIADALWHNRSRRDAKRDLNRALHGLRRVLEPGLQPFQSSRYIRCRGDVIRLQAGADGGCDIQRFEDALKKHKVRFADRTNSKAEIEGLQGVLQLRAGDFAADLPKERFLSDEADRIRDLWVRAARRLLSLLSDACRWEEVIQTALRGLDTDRRCESFHYRLASAYLAVGNRTKALGVCVDYETLMRRDGEGLISDRMMALKKESMAQAPTGKRFPTVPRPEADRRIHP